MSIIWERLHDWFDTDDGSLPGITLRGLSAVEIPVIFHFIRQHSVDVTRYQSYYWDLENECERSLTFVSNAAQLVIQGKAQGFHFVAGELKFRDTTIPDLGVGVFPEEIDLDYRMGKEWGPPQVEALFEFFYQIYLLAPQVRFLPDSWRDASQKQSNHFDLTFRKYLSTKL